MKVLITPMSAMAETGGPFSRARALALELVRQGHEAAFCAGEDVNYKPVEGIHNYPAPVPSPLGLPGFIGKRLFRMAQKTGAQQSKAVHSFEEVLLFAGALAGKYIQADVQCVRNAINTFNPDILYSEFRLTPLIAARMEGIRAVTGYSYPVQKSHACDPQFSGALRAFIRDNKLPPIESALELFDWAELKIIPSCHELEPVDDPKAVFTGPLMKTGEAHPEAYEKRNAIVCYMGSGTIAPEKALKVLQEAFAASRYEVYIASQHLRPTDEGNIHTAPRYDFNTLLPRAIAFINHGGQNSIMSGILHGAPQIVCPGKVFERKYNAASAASTGTGVCIETDRFDATTIASIVKGFETDRGYEERMAQLRTILLGQGGAEKAVRKMQGLTG